MHRHMQSHIPEEPYGSVQQHEILYEDDAKPSARRTRMNFFPMLLNLFLPWFMFCIAFYTFSSRFHHLYPSISWTVYGFTCLPVVMLWLQWLGLKAVHVAQGGIRGLVPKSWLAYSVFAFTAAVVGGAFFGLENYGSFLAPFYSATDMQSLANANPSVARGSFMLDAGKVNWIPGTELDFSRSWHFKNGDVYCVVPIVLRNADDNAIVEPASASYDFWAVGKNCCSVGSSDFQCGDYNTPGALASLRETRADDINMYRLAVMQAESMFDMVSAQPLFFSWVADPVKTLTEVKQVSRNNGIKICFSAFGFFALSLAATTGLVLYVEQSKRAAEEQQQIPHMGEAF